MGMENEFHTPPEEKLFREYLTWLELTKKLWKEFEQEGFPIPPTLKRALTDTNYNLSKKSSKKTHLKKPDEPEKPIGTNENWLWIGAREASLRTVVLSILNEGKALSIKELIRRTKEILPELNEGSIYNLGTQEEKILKTDEGWTLRSNTKAPILYKSYIWGLPNLLQKQDLAAFRRMVIRYLLETSPYGLQMMEIYRLLEGVDWLKVPLSKDLVKADLFLMKKEKKVRRLSGKSKKWTINKIPSKEEGNASE